jgi:hypothetical protein
MPAKKPSVLNDRDRHQSAADRDARASAESAMMPKTALTNNPPAALIGKAHAKAAGHWKRIISLYLEVDGTIATAFDENMIVKYCLVLEECDWLFDIRSEVEKEYREAAKFLSKIKPKGDQLKDYFGALSQVNALLTRLQGFDARLDGKRKLALMLEQSLYLTPRSRAGVSPKEKEKEQPKKGIDALLDE